MCGILGAIPGGDEHRFRTALTLLAPRGPDGEGTWTDGVIRLGHRRLAILDLSDAGRQPMQLRPGGPVIVFNGEIYNFVEIRRDLELKGCRFRSTSDTEVLLAAYETWGDACLSRLNGMWALAVWDPGNRSLFLSRDRFGKKPLFYMQTGDSFVFASEMKALLPFLPEIRVSKHFAWMRTHLHEYESTEECLVEGIRRLPAASWALLKNGRLATGRYWHTLDHLETPPRTYERQVERFRELFRDACCIRMRSDVRIGTALSGGLDSSSVMAAVADAGRQSGERISRDWQHAVTAVFPGTEVDEQDLARRVVNRTGVEQTEVVIDAACLPDRIEDDCFAFEEIYQTNPTPMILTYAAMRRNGIVVSLDGHGADELLAGYGESLFTAYPDCRNLNDVLDIIRTYRGLFGETRQFRVRSTAGCLVDYLTHWVFQPRVTAARRFLRRSASRALGEDRLRRWSGRTSAQEVVRSPFGVESLQEAADRPWPPGFDRLDAFGRHLYLLFHETTLPTLMRNYDRYAMANGVEVRAPFLDHRLVSYCFSLPWSSKVRGGFTKRILRDAMTDMLPPEIRLRKVKIGFGAPAVEWLQGGLRTYAQDTTSSREFLECPVLEDPAYTRARIERVLTAPQAQYRDAEASWTDLLTFLWYRTFIRNGAGRVKDAARKAAVAVAG